MENNCGIYKWTNKVNGKVYIGQSVDLSFRKLKFKCFSIKKYGGEYINRARQKYNNVDFWDYEILEYCSEEELNSKEIYYINYYNSTNPNIGYNLSCGGSGHSGYKQSEETKRKIGEAQFGEKNHMYGKTMSDDLRNQIKSAISGEHNAMWGKTHKDEVKEIISKKRSIPIYQLDLHTNEIIKEWKSSKEAATVLGFDNSNITSCCKGRTQHYKGFKWCYVDNTNENKIILQLDVNTNEVINEYKNAVEAGKALNIRATNIRQCCNKKYHTTGGFKWCYKKII